MEAPLGKSAAAAAGGAGHAQLQRVRLQFQSPDFDLGPLQRTWLLVPPSAREVNDLAWLICDKFKLKREWRQGILLEMEGFALSLTDPIEILRDHDTITKKGSETLKRRREERPVAAAAPVKAGSANGHAKSPEKKKRRKDDAESSESKRKADQEKKEKEREKGRQLAEEKAKQEREKKEAEAEAEAEKRRQLAEEQAKRQEKEKPKEKEPKKQTEKEKEEESSSEDESSSSEDESSSSSSSSSSSDDDSSSSEDEAKAKEPDPSSKAKPSQQQQQPSATNKPADAATPVKGHVRFGANGQPQQQQSARWGVVEAEAAASVVSTQQHRRQRPVEDADAGPGLPARTADSTIHRPMAHHLTQLTLVQTWGSDIAYAAGFAAQPSASPSMGEQQAQHYQPSLQSQSPFAPAAGGHQRDGGHDAGQDRRAGYRQQQQAPPPVLYSSDLDWKKDTHPSYTSPPPLEPPKDYSRCPAFSLSERTPRRGDVIAYQVLEMKDGGPSYSAHKEATIESYDARTTAVCLRANNLSSVPLDGSYVASEEDRAALFQSPISLVWDQLADVKLVTAAKS